MSVETKDSRAAGAVYIHAALRAAADRKAHAERARTDAMLDVAAGIIVGSEAAVPIAEMARLANVTRQTVYDVLGRQSEQVAAMVVRRFGNRDEYHAAYPEAEPSTVGAAVAGSDYGHSFNSEDRRSWLVTFSAYGSGADHMGLSKQKVRGNVVACRNMDAAERADFEVLVLAEDVTMANADEALLPAASTRLEWVIAQCRLQLTPRI